MELDLKKIVEEQLGYEVDNIQVEPVFTDGKITSLNITVQSNSFVKFIDINIVITKNGITHL